MKKMWLDDLRPAPDGWVHVFTVEEAVSLLTDGDVVEASLDHDLGMCDDCSQELSDAVVSCRHRKTGYDIVLWMAEHSVWPETVSVHSMNPVGRDSMIQTIRRYKPGA